MVETSPAAPSDEADSGDHLTAVFGELRDRLIGFLAVRLGNYGDAHDVVQEAFLKCWRGRDRLSDVRDLRSWIFRVALHAAQDLQRNAWRRHARPLDRVAAVHPAPDASPPETAMHHEKLQRVRAALRDLRPAENEVFLLRQNHGLTYEEIGVRIDRPTGTVKGQMRSALLILRQVLQDRPSQDAEARGLNTARFHLTGRCADGNHCSCHRRSPPPPAGSTGARNP
jgi:RNA polymerase sigma-70 factor (ECF subfamily)